MAPMMLGIGDDVERRQVVKLSIGLRVGDGKYVRVSNIMSSDTNGGVGKGAFERDSV